MKILNKWWYTDCFGRCMGIVKVEDELTQIVKFRVGIAGGLDEQEDALQIARFGDTFIPEAVK